MAPGAPLVPLDGPSAGATAALVLLPAPLQPAACADGEGAAAVDADASAVADALHREQGVRCVVRALGGWLWAHLPVHVYRGREEFGIMARAVADLAASE
eukprot:2948883-Prymnesium_polylepis.1